MWDLKENKICSALKKNISRRKFLALGLATAAASAFPFETLAAVNTIVTPGRALSFYNIYTQEELNIVYWFEGRYLPDALARINHILRDLRTGKVTDIDNSLLDLLYGVQKKLKSKDPFNIVSGYRTPKSNAILRKRRRGVAINSLHMYGKAVDLNLPGYSLSALRRVAMSLGHGGVGYYPYSKFVHLDVGEVRSWTG